MSQHVTVHLTAEQRHHLESLIRKGKAPARVQTRARILLLADRSQGEQRRQKQVAEATLTDAATVCQVSRRFALEGMESALAERPRPGQAPKITGDVEAQLCLLACSDPPVGYAKWTLKLLAGKLVELGCVESLSDVAVYHRLKKIQLSHGASKPGVSAPPLPAL